MVGGRRKGCITCRKRKIKVDSLCPSPNPPARVFSLTSASATNGGRCAITVRDPTVNVSARPLISSSNFRKSYRTSHSLPSRPSIFKDPVYTFEKRKCRQRPLADEIAKSIIKTSDSASCSSTLTSNSPTTFPFSPAEDLVGKLVSSLYTGTEFGSALLYFGEYFQELPSFIGRSDCHDAAVECFLCSQQHLNGLDPPNSDHQLDKYGRALRLLHHGLIFPRGQSFAEILCSTTVLHSAEVRIDLDFPTAVRAETKPFVN